MNPYQPLIDYAKTEHIRLLIETYKDGLTIIYCDKTEKRNILKQIRLNKIKHLAKIICYDYKMEFCETPALIELNYIRGKIIKTFQKKKEREIEYFRFSDKGKKYKIAFVDFPNNVKDEIIKKITGRLRIKRLPNTIEIIHGYNLVENQDRDTLILYYKDGSE